MLRDSGHFHGNMIWAVYCISLWTSTAISSADLNDDFMQSMIFETNTAVLKQCYIRLVYYD